MKNALAALFVATLFLTAAAAPPGDAHFAYDAKALTLDQAFLHRLQICVDRLQAVHDAVEFDGCSCLLGK